MKRLLNVPTLVADHVNPGDVELRLNYYWLKITSADQTLYKKALMIIATT